MRKSFLVMMFFILAVAAVIGSYVAQGIPKSETKLQTSTPRLPALRGLGLAEILKRHSPTPKGAEEAVVSDMHQALETVTPQFMGIEGLSLRTCQPLMLKVPRIQGLALTDQFYYVSASDPRGRVALLFQLDRDRRTVSRMRDVTQEGRFELGGIDAGTRFLWVPVAGSGRSTIILGLDLQHLEVQQRFKVDDYIAAIAQGRNGHLYGVNEDSTVIYEWAPDGQELRRVPRVSGVRYRDMDVVRGSLVCAGVEQGSGVIDVIDPESLTLLARHRCYAQSESGQWVTNRGFAYADQLFYFLPEGGEFPMLMFYSLDGVSLSAYVPNVQGP